MNGTDRSDRFCIVGAGAAGLTAAKNFLEHGLDVEVIERADDVGGIWYYENPTSSIYASTRMISSRRLTEYTDFPMPSDAPPYLHHRQVWHYLRRYAEHFDLRRVIRFHTGVEHAQLDGPLWSVRLSDGTCRRYRGLIVANGHNWHPRRPNWPGRFEGTVLHSSQYKTPDVLAGKRVLVVGAGNSGCDIAVEAARHAAVAFHSVRRGYHYIPKFLFGKPADETNETLLRLRLPLWLRRWISGMAIRLALGAPERVGLPRPDHRLFETHPIVNSELFYYLGHGAIRPKPDVAELCGREVRFADGTREAVDLMICATGFQIVFPFLPQDLVPWRDGRPDFYLNVFHPLHDHLFAIGLIQPDSGMFGLMDLQAQLAARFVRAQRENPPLADWLRQRKRRGHQAADGGIRYLASPRHALEVEHFSYRRLLQRHVQRLSRLGPVRSAGGSGLVPVTPPR